mmetsp:Transcript_35900/g.89609  ORF Transcript_35900/g.89609 Transcript_35900/m.89609 type:complete len:256 (+) Transcript_35900:152-919(+)
MVRGERERGKDRVLEVLPAARVIFGRAHDGEAPAREEDKVLRVLVAHVRLVEVGELHRLVELRLQVGARVEGGVVGRVWPVAPAGREAELPVLVRELEHALLVRRAVLVGVGVQTKEQHVPGQRGCAGEFGHRLHHRDRGEPVRVAMKGGEEELSRGLARRGGHARDGESDHVARRDGDVLARLGKDRVEGGGAVHGAGHVEAGLAHQDSGVLIALAVGGRGEAHVELGTHGRGAQRLHECHGDLLQEDDVGIAV